jgi:hypothetical protein
VSLPDAEKGSEPARTPGPIVTYSLEEDAAMVLPADWKDGARWLGRKLLRNEISGYKVSRGVWRMTHADVEDFIARHRSTPPRTPEPKPLRRRPIRAGRPGGPGRTSNEVRSPERFNTTVGWESLGLSLTRGATSSMTCSIPSRPHS